MPVYRSTLYIYIYILSWIDMKALNKLNRNCICLLSLDDACELQSCKLCMPSWATTTLIRIGGQRNACTKGCGMSPGLTSGISRTVSFSFEPSGCHNALARPLCRVCLGAGAPEEVTKVELQDRQTECTAAKARAEWRDSAGTRGTHERTPMERCVR